MHIYKIFLILPIFKTNSFSQNIIFNQSNFLSRSSETRSLVEALNSSIKFEKMVNITMPKVSTFLSHSIIDEIKTNLNIEKIDLIVVDCSLSPIQHRNLEKILEVKVIDRTQLIIEIFGLRATSSEGKIQVELANLNFQKTRLVRSWTHLERQRGGLSKVGGPGESQLELDKRIIDTKIVNIKKQLLKVKKTRNIQRKRRTDISLPIFSLVGYTNSGKSTIFNKLTSSQVLVKDMVFATLDTKMSLVNLPNQNKILLTDTVGFISALPTELISAFNSSLEELFSSDFLLLVHDLSNPNIENQAHVVLQTLKQIGFSEDDLKNKIINVFNKIDLNSEMPDLNIYNKKKFIMTSAMTSVGLNDLRKYIENKFIGKTHIVDFFISITSYYIFTWLFKNSHILLESNKENSINERIIRVKISSHQLDKFRSFFPEIKIKFI